MAAIPFSVGVAAYAQAPYSATSDLHLHKFEPKLSPEAAFRSAVDQTVDSDGISRFAKSQMSALQQEKASRTPAQQKIDSNVLYTIRMLRGQDAAPGVSYLETGITLDGNDNIVIDMIANVTDTLLEKLSAAGATVLSSYPSTRSIRAIIAPGRIEALATLPDVIYINPMEMFATHRRLAVAKASATSTLKTAPALTGKVARVQQMLAQAQTKLGRGQGMNPNVVGTPTYTGQGSVETEGDITHQAYQARQAFGINGAGLKIGVLSDGVSHISTSQATGDVPPTCGSGVPSPCLTVLAGSTGDEGTAILEIVHDMVPGADLYFATGGPGAAGFAANIRALRTAGCNIIIDDLGYFAESPFQDGQTSTVASTSNGGIITQAVNDVVASGAFYFSSAGNEGSLDQGTSGTWEGDFNPMAAPTGVTSFPTTGGMIHNFGGGVGYDTVTNAGYPYALLFWSDPLGGSANDYDLYRLNSTGTAVRSSSAAIQNGTQDPYESLSSLSKGDRLVIYQKPGAANRFLHLNVYDGTIAIATSGQTYGHPGATGAYGVAATPAYASFGTPTPQGPYPGIFVGSNQTENFSSDGPRHIFFNADSTPITPGNFSSTGGTVLSKPDITAADGVSITGSGGFGNPFYGTSAAAPSAASVAALVLSAKPTITAAQMKTALTSTAVDIMGTGIDRDSGAGIVMAFPAIQSLGITGNANPELGTITAVESPGDGNGIIEAGEGALLTIPLKNATGVLAATGITATLTTSTSGVTILQPATSAYGDLVAGAGAENSVSPFKFTLAPNIGCGVLVQFTLTVSYSSGQTRVLPFNVQTGMVTISNTLGSTPMVPTGITFATGLQTQIESRNGVKSSCSTAKNFPGIVSSGSQDTYDSYTFKSCSSVCLQPQLNIAAGYNLFETLYSPSFSPTSLSTNYKGDPGLSNTIQTFGVQVAASTNYSIVVSDVYGNPAPAGLSNTYTLQVPTCAFNCATPYPLPIASAQNVTVAAGANGTANASINNGSNDPNGGAITLSQSPAGPYPVGTTSVILTVTNKNGAFTQATATVTVTSNPVTGFKVSGIPLKANFQTAYTGTITAVDSSGNPVTNFTGTVTLSASDPSVTLNPTSYTFTTADAGVTSFQAAFANIGTFSITATFGSFTGSETGIVVRMPLVFVAGTGGVESLAGDGSVTSAATAGNQVTGSSGLAVDANGIVWSIDLPASNFSISNFTPSGAANKRYGPSLRLNANASALAIDGSSQVWITDDTGKVTLISNAGSKIYAIQGSTTVAPSAIAIDQSGDVWITNPTTNTIDEIIGGAPPAAPLSTAVKNGTPGVRP